MKYLSLLFIVFLNVILISGCKKPSSYFNSFNDSDQANLNGNADLDFKLTGNTTGYGNLRTDGTADFGLVLKSFSKSDLFQIELNDLMSTEFDQISVIGSDIDIPTNVAIPNQKERYILSITLNKPKYKVNFKKDEHQNLVLIHGQFPFDDVVKGFRNDEPLLKLIDKFNILSYSEYNFENKLLLPELNLDLIAGQSIHTDQFTIKSPKQFSSDYSFVVVSLNKDNNRYLPNNLTVLAADKSKLLKTASRDSYIFSGLIHESFADSESTNINKYRMSFQLNNTQNWSSELLGFIDNLAYKSGQLTFKLPSSLSFNSQGLAYIIYEMDSVGLEVPVYQGSELGFWPNSLNLNLFENLRKPNFKYRIDLYLMGSKQAEIPRQILDLYEYSEFVTRNSLYL